jgi:hypothetical protein
VVSGQRFDRFAGVICGRLAAGAAARGRRRFIFGHGCGFVARLGESGGQYGRIDARRNRSATSPNCGGGCRNLAVWFVALVGNGGLRAIIAARTAILSARPQPATAAAFAQERIFDRLVGALGAIRVASRSGIDFAVTRTILVAAGARLLIAGRSLIAPPIILGRRSVRSSIIAAISIASGFTCPILGQVLGPILTAIFWRTIRGALGAILTFAAGVDRRLIERGEIAFDVEIARLVTFVAAFFAALLPAVVAAQALLFLPHAGVANHPEIVIGKLQIIFRIHPVAVEMRVVRQLAIFFEHLRGVPACPAVDPVDLLPAASTLRAGAVATPAPAVIATTIVVQGCVFLSPGLPPDIPAGDVFMLNAAVPTRSQTPTSATD